MVHKSSFIPGLSRFIDENILSHYPASSMKRILMAGATSIYLKQNEGIVDTIMNNPLVSSLGVVKGDGEVDIDLLRDVLKTEIKKANFMRLTLPLVGNVDFTSDDVDALYRFIVEADSANKTIPNSMYSSNNLVGGGVY